MAARRKFWAGVAAARAALEEPKQRFLAAMAQAVAAYNAEVARLGLTRLLIPERLQWGSQQQEKDEEGGSQDAMTSALPSPLASSPASSALASRSGSVTSSAPGFGFAGNMQQAFVMSSPAGLQSQHLSQGQFTSFLPGPTSGSLGGGAVSVAMAEVSLPAVTKAPVAVVTAAKPSVARRQHKLALMRAAAASGRVGDVTIDFARLHEEMTARQMSVIATNVLSTLQVALAITLSLTGFELRTVVGQALFYTCCAFSVIGTCIALTSMSYFAPRALCGGRSGKKRRRSRVGDATSCLQQTIKRFNAAMFVAGWLGLGTSLSLMFILVDAHAELYLWATWSFYGIVGGIGAWALIGQGLVLPACGKLGRCVRKGS